MNEKYSLWVEISRFSVFGRDFFLQKKIPSYGKVHTPPLNLERPVCRVEIALFGVILLPDPLRSRNFVGAQNPDHIEIAYLLRKTRKIKIVKHLKTTRHLRLTKRVLRRTQALRVNPFFWTKSSF